MSLARAVPEDEPAKVALSALLEGFEVRGAAKLEDLGSKNGTHLKGERIRGVVPLVDGDEIRIGPVAMTFRVMSRVGTTETEEKGRGGTA